MSDRDHGLGTGANRALEPGREPAGGRGAAPRDTPHGGAPHGGAPHGGALGELLRNARAERGLELADIAELTHVRREYLRALEEGRYDDLPEDVYTRNFVRLFAQATGLEVDGTLELYTRERRSAVGMTTLEESLDRDRRGETPPPPPIRRGSGLGTLLPTLLLVAVVVALAVWGFNSLLFRPGRGVALRATPAPAAVLPEPAAAETPSVPAPGSLDAPAGTVGGNVETFTVRVSIATEPPGASVTIDGFALPGTTPITGAPVTARQGRIVRVSLDGYEPIEQAVDLRADQQLSYKLAPVQAAAGDAAGAATAPPAAGGVAAGQIGIDITETTWLEVYQSTARNTGARLVYTTAEPGAHYLFDLPVFVHVGNAAGVHITLEGQDRGPLGSAGAVLSRAYPRP